MSLITAINISVRFAGKEIFSNVGFQVDPGERIGLVGPNGSGKTSLLRMLVNEVSPDSGEIRVASGVCVGYLSQNVHERISGTLLKFLLDSVPGRLKIRDEIQRIEKILKNNLNEQEQKRQALRLAELHHDMARLDIDYPAHKAEKILEGLGFKSDDMGRPVSELSGGWRMRAALASILYQSPDLILLDEPTNHLDIPSVRWLEQFLKKYNGAMILVCHDREFLNHQVGRVISIEPEGIRSYAGNYDAYLQSREEEEKTLEAKARNQELKIKEAKKFIERFRYKATKARQAQSKLKLLEKIEMVRTHQKNKTIRFSFPEAARSGRVVASIRGLSKGFGKIPLYRGVDLTVMSGERVAIIGTNGAGKTTLLRIIANEIQADRGEISLGHNVEISYYAQHHSEMLNPNRTILEEVYQIVPHESISFVRGVCGAFLFSGDDVDKPIKVLSGGEKARVCLARMLIKPGNFLVMDEPTNHLDLNSSEILIDALSDYNGTLLFVSHNQSFINRLVTKVWDIRSGQILEYPGTLEEYYTHLNGQEVASDEESGRAAEKMDDQNYILHEKSRQGRKERKRVEAEKRSLVNTTLKPIQLKLSKLEEGISKLEKREKAISDLLADPDFFKDKDKSLPLLDEYGKVKRDLEDSMEKWERFQEELESVQEMLEAQDSDSC